MGNEKSKGKDDSPSREILERNVSSGTEFVKADTVFYSPYGGLDSDKHKARPEVPSYKLIKTDTLGIDLETFYRRYDLSTEVLGRGSFAEVRLAKDRRNGEQFAVKIMQKRKMNERDLEDVRREVEILKNLDHENIVKVYEYYEDDNFVHVVMEYLSGGELYKNVADLVDFTENDTRDIMLTLIDALLYCKNRGIAHRDIKPENILLRNKIIKSKKFGSDHVETDSNTGLAAPKLTRETSFRAARRKYEIALADFGFAIQVGKQEFAGGHSMETQCGTPLFIAPEIIQKKSYNYKCDVWSLGVVCYMLLSGGTLPFPARSLEELYEKVLKGKFYFKPESVWENVSPLAKKFVEKCLVLNPKKRATYETLLRDQWFKDNSFERRPIHTVNFSPMKKFNARRKVLKAMKARQAAMKFKALMDDLEKEESSNSNFRNYMKTVQLTDFYKNPNIRTKAEENYEKHGMIEMEVPKPPGISKDGPAFTSIYFKDLDDHL